MTRSPMFLHRLRPCWLPVAAIAAVLASPPAAHGQQTAPGDLSLEDLMRVPVQPVFGASLRVQPLTEAPASVTIVTADDIARAGYQTIGELLADVRGFHITSDRNYSYVGARGFALPGDYNTRVLLVVDGHRINDAIFEQSVVGRDLAVDVRSIERVEIIRGPASALYGTSAFFAVVNVVTRTGQSVDGVEAAVQGGTLRLRTARLTAGRRFRNGVDGVVTASAGGRHGPSRLYFPEFDAPDTNGGIAEDLDNEDYRQVAGRVNIGRLTFTAAAVARDKQVPTASYATIFGDPRFVTTDTRAYVQARLDHDIGATRMVAQASVDRYRYEGVYPEMGQSPDQPVDDLADGRWWSADVRLSRTVARRHELTGGVNLRHTFRALQSTRYRGDEPHLLVDSSSTVVGLYGQHEMAMSRYVRLTAGLRYDDYAGFDRVTPRVALVVTPSDDQAIKYLFGHAFRAPNAYELDYYAATRRLELAPERVASHEVVWERYSGRWLRTSASVYTNGITDLIRFTGEDNDTYRFENLGRVRSRGLELEAEARHRSGLRAQASYALQEAIDREGNVPLTNSPRHAFKVLTSATGPRQSTAALSVQHLGSRLALDGSDVPGVTLVNLSVRVPLARHVRLTMNAANLFDVAYGDPGSAEHVQRTIPRDGRTLSIGLEWSSSGR